MPHPAPHRPELLAPAGDREALRAAVANGADAVYFGLSNFNARARAANFTAEELPEVMRFLHARNVRGFVTLNTLIFPDELPAVAEFVKAVADAGADAVIVQDLGLVRLIRRLAPTLPVHASTQMTLTEPRGIEFVRRLGVERVVLARAPATTQTYRKASDAKLAEREFHLSRREELDLAQTFSRGFTPGFLEGVNHQRLVRGRFPKSRGVRLGTVVGVRSRGVRVELAESV